MTNLKFREEKINETIVHLQSLLEELRTASHKIADSIQMFAEKNNIPNLTEKMIRQRNICEEQCEQLEMLMQKLKGIREVYINIEMKNIQLVKNLPHLSQKGTDEKRTVEHVKPYVINFEKEEVYASRLIKNNALQHEDWLLQAIEKFINKKS